MSKDMKVKFYGGTVTFKATDCEGVWVSDANTKVFVDDIDSSVPKGYHLVSYREDKRTYRPWILYYPPTADADVIAKIIDEGSPEGTEIDIYSDEDYERRHVDNATMVRRILTIVTGSAILAGACIAVRRYMKHKV